MFKILVCEGSLTYSAKDLFLDYKVDVAYDKQDILDMTFKTKYDLFIVNYYFYDLMVELENYNKSSIVIFVDEYYDIEHIRNAFKIGDEYLVNPISLDEIAIRVDYFYEKLFNKRRTISTYKDFFYHKNTKQLFQGDKLIKLTPNELKLIELFMIYIDKPITKDNLYEYLDNYSDGNLRVYISKLNKIGFDIQYDRSNRSYTLKSNTYTQ